MTKMRVHKMQILSPCEIRQNTCSVPWFWLAQKILPRSLWSPLWIKHFWSSGGGQIKLWRIKFGCEQLQTFVCVEVKVKGEPTGFWMPFTSFAVHCRVCLASLIEHVFSCNTGGLLDLLTVNLSDDSELSLNCTSCLFQQLYLLCL